MTAAGHTPRVGDVYEKWTVVGGPQRLPSRKKMIPCRCVCGKERTVYRYRLLNGQSRSCGCDHPSRQPGAGTRHGHSRPGSPEYRSWQGMLRRCDPKYAAKYSTYARKGITVCERWMVFENFLLDMGHRPLPGDTIDRIDNDGNYEPSNCRWASKKVQARGGVKWTVVVGGVERQASDVAKEVGINHGGLVHRIRAGWPDEIAATKPPCRALKGERNPHALLTRDQVLQIRSSVKWMSTRSVADAFGIGLTTVQQLQSGTSWPDGPWPWFGRANTRQAKLTAEQAEQIRANRGWMSQGSLAEAFGVSKVTVSAIHTGRVWSGAIQALQQGDVL